ncbi:LysR family transcriptional regulator [Paenibacillus sinopodophylli]|uniref:LysR family transcriptional regulator n=1 Tax=Paenibacillus sinopodophylli TaxID=1837342 RepID=UPI00110CF988|nr:LysR family transcriptional regulator [Paenibacillus sinopodophylli]
MLESWEGRFFLTFAAVLEESSFSRAADRLGYVQSTVTAHIRHLEDSTGKKLFHRLPRGVEPTEAGLRLAPYAYQFIRLGQSLEEAMADSESPSGIVRIGALESFAVSHLPRFLTSFLKQFTRIKLHIAPGLHKEITSLVATHRADLGIVPKPPERDNLLFTPLLKEKLLLVCSPLLKEQFEREGSKALQHSSFISFGEQCIYHTYGCEQLMNMKVEPSEQLTFSSTELIKQTVSCGMGISFLPASNVVQEISAGMLQSLPISHPLSITHGIITHKSREPNAASKTTLHQLKRYFVNK